MRDQAAAVALGYEPNKGQAPKVLAAGFSEIATKILKVAKDNELYIHEDKNLAKLLAQAPVGQDIPEDAGTLPKTESRAHTQSKLEPQLLRLYTHHDSSEEGK